MLKCEIKVYIKGRCESYFKDNAESAIESARRDVRFYKGDCYTEVYEEGAGLIYSSRLDWDL